MIKVILKSMVTTLKQDLLDFGIARRACRSHVFRHASLKHEPQKLVNSLIRGPSLFPEAGIVQTIPRAAATGQSLRYRRGLSPKRIPPP